MFEAEDDLASFAVELMLHAIRQKPSATICVASGHSPARTYHLFVEQVISEGVDVSQVTWIGLDEWVGIAATNPGSCQHALRQQLLGPLGIEESKIHFFDAAPDQLEAACAHMDNVIAAAGGIDFMVLGVGPNGHLGLNEPGTPPHLLSHVSQLSPETIQTGQKYFSTHTVLSQGITLGLGHVLAARTLLVIAQGPGKQAAIQRALVGEISPTSPASFLQQHPHAWVLLDHEAGKGLWEQLSAS